MSNAKKATAVKKTAKKAAPRKRAAPRVIEGALIDEPQPEATGAGEVDEVGVGVVNVPLSHRGKRTGQTHPLRVQRPTDSQIVWFEAAAHRFDLAMEAWREGAELDEGERGEVYNDALSAMNVFVATRYDRAWVSQALAAGILELDGLIDAIHQAKDVLDLAPAPGAGADIVIP